MPKILSGKQAINILTKYFDFVVISQKGSHVKLKKITKFKNIITIVPVHKQLARGTLRSVLKLAQIEYENFYPYMTGKKK
ncbi:MAG: hypothetical protein A2319_01915 [Candidatus Kerfeldbacteria bacterium RIFOXYB2_FULL_38_14]|uniref:Addiction module toxin, HicA family n=1 Tax=Candidatus Kerfeldbacteria bacterium RIFOXYB2_FULL_38_14 TaxID=1798547 RepID=A0A1G2BE26_9BACT|nr:MAG: hypothetical protein A2319_01915 [Candidatus Kerfeldbacteria bacterium RIFOXYB2_FULL_38_14]